MNDAVRHYPVFMYIFDFALLVSLLCTYAVNNTKLLNTVISTLSVFPTEKYMIVELRIKVILELQ